MSISDLSATDREIVLRALWHFRLGTGREMSGDIEVGTEISESGVGYLEMIDAVAAKLGGQRGVPIYGAFR
jgi:hypothetical protein